MLERYCHGRAGTYERYCHGRAGTYERTTAVLHGNIETLTYSKLTSLDRSTYKTLCNQLRFWKDACGTKFDIQRFAIGVAWLMCIRTYIRYTLLVEAPSQISWADFYSFYFERSRRRFLRT
jgi:hypothetical protein